MNSRTKWFGLIFSVFLCALLMLSLNSPQNAQALSSTIVISQVYGGGGNTGAQYQNDFIELFNRGNTTVSLSGWSVQYASASGTTWSVTNLAGSIAPGKYYLVKEAAGASCTGPCGAALPTADATGTIAMSAASAKVAVVNTTTALSGGCPTSASILDKVGYGSSATCSETSPTANLSNTTSAQRKTNGCTETDNNANDFSVAAPAPRNSATTANVCGATATPTKTNTPIPPTPTNTSPPPTATNTPLATSTPTYTAIPPTPTTTATSSAGALQVHFIDVGQGNSALVVAPSGKTMLVDTGVITASVHVANYIQSVLGTKTIDYLVVTHYHADHFGAYTDMLRNQGVSITTATYDRGGDHTEYNSSIYTDYYDFCTTQNPTACKRTTLRENDTLNLGVGLTAKVLCMGSVSPRIGACGQTVMSENDNSALILVSMGSFDIWLGGDTSGDIAHSFYADVETAAVNQGKIGAYLDVYGVDHHGSCYSTNQNLVNATHPTVSVFSLGANTYGHPCQTVVDRLTTAGSNIYYTENSSGQVVDGDVKIVYSGASTYTVTGVKGTTTFTTK